MFTIALVSMRAQTPILPTTVPTAKEEEYKLHGTPERKIDKTPLGQSLKKSRKSRSTKHTAAKHHKKKHRR